MTDPAFTWDKRPGRRAGEGHPTASESVVEPLGGRISLREAEHRFGVTLGALRGWARRGLIDAVMAEGPRGRQWMVTPESIAHRLARTARDASAPSRPGATGPSADGTAMLVPRDAWDRLMDQLGNLHEAGLRLAEARERAAKAETEATFLRERLGEIRSERDELKSRLGAVPTAPVVPAAPELPRRPTGWEALKRWWNR